MLDAQQIDSIVGAEVYGPDGDKIGKVAQVYFSNTDQQVEWLTVTTGLFGTRESFVPARDASWSDGAAHVTVTKDQVKDAPQISADGDISSDEEDELYRYYNLRDTDTAPAREYVGGQRYRDEVHGETVGRDASGPTTDEAMTRSKEELRVGTQTQEAGRARLRKYVTTEQQTVTVPVSHEEVILTREPITDANRDDAEDSPSISEEEYEIVLHAERPVISTRTVPVERVSLGKETVTENQDVTGEVREEHIELHDHDGEVHKLTENQNQNR